MAKAGMTDEEREICEIEWELQELAELMEEDANKLAALVADLEKRTAAVKRRLLADAETG